MPHYHANHTASKGMERLVKEGATCSPLIQQKCGSMTSVDG